MPALAPAEREELGAGLDGGAVGDAVVVAEIEVAEIEVDVCVRLVALVDALDFGSSLVCSPFTTKTPLP